MSSLLRTWMSWGDWPWKTASLPELAGAAVLALLASLVLGGATVGVPNLSAGVLAPLPTVAVAALLPVAGLLRAWRRIPPALAVTSTRRLWAFATCGMFGTVALPMLCGLLLAGAVGPTSLARDVLGFIGVAVVAWRLAGRDVAIAAPAVALLLMCLFGRSSEGLLPRPWAWALSAPTDLASWALPVALAAVSLALLPGLPSRDVNSAAD